MSRSYLDLCRLLVSELGIAGGTGPASVTGQSAELRNVVQWVAEADVYVQNKWADWDFLWTQATGQFVPAGQAAIGSVTQLATAYPGGLVLDVGGRPYRPEQLGWDDFRARYGLHPPRTGRVAAWAIRPDRSLALSHAVAADTFWTLDYYRAARRMAANNDRSPIPDRYDRIIVARAAVTYGMREDAPEIVSGYAAEYDELLEMMEHGCLMAQRGHGAASGRFAPAPDWSGT